MAGRREQNGVSVCKEFRVIIHRGHALFKELIASTGRVELVAKKLDMGNSAFLARKHDGEPGAKTIWLGI